MFLRIAILLAVLGTVGCTDRTMGPDQAPVASKPDNSVQSVMALPAIDVRAASGAQCPAGGSVYTVFLDADLDGIFESDEEAKSVQVVCNGVNGQNGADGANGTDGANGADGQNGVNGTNGSDGHSVVFSTVAAPSSVCHAGGTILLLALDVVDGGVYSPLLPHQQSLTVCNGVDGADGQNGADAPAPAFAPVEAILACGATVAYKEVLLRLANGQVLGSFSDNASGANTRLAFLPDGTYANTDGSGCVFALSTSADGHTRSVSWGGQVQKSWALP